jgi:sulfite reductase alpha subunit-like flavoprotein
VHLFFGCRSAEGDFLYRQEWQQLQQAGVLAGLHTAFSRDQPQKVYVTHLIRQQAALVWQLLQQAS